MINEEVLLKLKEELNSEDKFIRQNETSISYRQGKLDLIDDLLLMLKTG